MTARKAPVPELPKITIDDVKHRAESVTDLAVSEAKGAVTRVTQTDGAKLAMFAVGAVVLVASVAFYLGTRSAQGSADDFA